MEITFRDLIANLTGNVLLKGTSKGLSLFFFSLPNSHCTLFVPASEDFIAGRVSPDHDILWASHIAGREHGMHKKTLSCGMVSSTFLYQRKNHKKERNSTFFIFNFAMFCVMLCENGFFTGI